MKFTAKEFFFFLLKGVAGFYIPTTIFLAFFTLFGVIPINFNGEQYYGMAGFIFHLLFSPFMILVLTISMWVPLFFGIKMSSLFLKLFEKNSDSKA